MGKFLKEYRIEVGAVISILLGVFLLVEQFDIIPTVKESVLAIPKAVHTYVMNYIANFSPSDLLGWILILAALGVIGWQVRSRYMRSPRYRSKICPRCGGSLQRVRRSSLDRFLSQYALPEARRYRCANPDCRWSGLRYHEPHIHQQLSEEDSASVDQNPQQS